MCDVRWQKYANIYYVWTAKIEYEIKWLTLPFFIGVGGTPRCLTATKVTSDAMKRNEKRAQSAIRLEKGDFASMRQCRDEEEEKKTKQERRTYAQIGSMLMCMCSVARWDGVLTEQKSQKMKLNISRLTRWMCSCASPYVIVWAACCVHLKFAFHTIWKWCWTATREFFIRCVQPIFKCFSSWDAHELQFNTPTREIRTLDHHVDWFTCTYA